ncbi:hypothetical protein [Paenibacillus sp. NPDC058174]|uniref:hypothetical protein n=1 Tax=Paenibacillus sp. NPDC058174 TaxID=3346366 RepID=UPI0036DF7083
MRPAIGDSETAAVLVIVDGELYVMGSNGLTSTIYHPLAFKPSKKIKELIEHGIDFRHVAADMLQTYAGDRLFLLVGEDQVSLVAEKLLSQSAHWQGLLPVQRNFVYRMHAKWNYDDSITLERLLNVLPCVMGNSNSIHRISSRS